MRLHVNHATVYRYDPPALGAIQILRLTPRNHQGQYVVKWRIDISENCRLRMHEDAFGNITHSFALDGPIGELRVLVEGEVETQDSAGVVRGTVERFPPSLYRRETELTAPSPALRRFAVEATADAEDALAKLHALMAGLHEAIDYDAEPPLVTASAQQVFERKTGGCQDFAHVFIAAARHLGIPTRFISGYRMTDQPGMSREANHGWAEAFIDDLGWVAFDAANMLCATDAYIRVAAGLDYLGAAPVRGNRYGGGEERLAVAVAVDQSSRQIQG